jgi:DNA polymerase-1
MLNMDLPPALWFSGDSPEWDLTWMGNVLRNTKLMAIDTETTGLGAVNDHVLYWSLSWREDAHAVHRGCLRADLLPRYAKYLADPDRRWALANAKFDMHMLANSKAPLNGEVADVQVMHGLLYEEERHGLKEITKDILGWVWAGFSETFGKTNPRDPTDTIGRRLIECEKTNLHKLVEYASNDAYGTLMLYEELKKMLRASTTWSVYPDLVPTMWEYFELFELPFTRVLWHCEREGLGIDMEELDRILDSIVSEEKVIEKEIWRAAGRPLSAHNPDQLIEYFYGEKKFPVKKMTGGGASGKAKPSVDADELEVFKDQGDPVAPLILRKKELANLRTTFLGGIKRKVDKYGRVHTRYNQSRVVTGRLSSADPNLQNVKSPDNDTFHIRKLFIPDPGNALVVADYTALEMMLLGEASGDEILLSIFDRGWDVHMGNAAMVFDLQYEDLEKAKKIEKLIKKGELPESAMTTHLAYCLVKRQHVKTVSYGLNYGMKDEKLALSLGIPVAEAREVSEKYMARYPAVREFFANTEKLLNEKGCVYTMLGRRRSLPEIASPYKYKRWQAGRRAANFIIQGSAAEVARGAMLRLHYEKKLASVGGVMLSQVHDEILTEVPIEAAEEGARILQEAMENPLLRRLRVKLKGSPTIGRSWYDAKLLVRCRHEQQPRQRRRHDEVRSGRGASRRQDGIQGYVLSALWESSGGVRAGHPLPNPRVCAF